MGQRRRIWAKLRDPNRPDRLLVGVRGEVEPWELLLTLNGVSDVSKKTRYEALQERLSALRENRLHLQQQSKEVHDKAAAALSQGQPASLPRDYDTEFRALDAAIKLLEVECKRPGTIREHVAARCADIDKERQAMHKEKAPYIKKVENLTAQLAAAQVDLERVAMRQQDKYERLSREEMQLRKLEECLDEQLPADEIEDAPDTGISPDKAPDRVDAFLKELREGKMRSIITGQDPDIDRAYRIYEEERQALRTWASGAALVRRTSFKGPGPAAPACAALYSRERLKEITQKKDLPATKGSVAWRAHAGKTGSVSI